MKRLAHAPLLHFALLGGALFAIARGASGWQAAERRTPSRLVIAAAAVEEERRAFIARAGRVPTAAEMAELRAMLVDDELLWREALALQLDREDPVVLRRLVRNLRFLRGVDGETVGDAAELYTEALALGLDRSDEVIRRRLIERMRLRVQQQARALEPTVAEIDAYIEDNRTRFIEPERIALTQIFLSRERRGRRLTDDAQALLGRLAMERIAPAEAVRFGDPGLAATRLALESRRGLSRRFGAEFAERVLRQRPGEWAGPVPSAYGLHLVWVHEATAPRLPSLESVRAPARELLLAERANAGLGETLQRLRERYDVRVEDAGLRSVAATVDRAPPRLVTGDGGEP